MDLYDLKDYKKKLEEYKIEDEKNVYIFRANKKYIISSSIFFIIILFVASYSLYKGIAGIENLTLIKIILIFLLFVYVTVSSFMLFKYKIVIKGSKIISGKLKIDMNEIESAIIKIDRVNLSKYDRYLEIITKDKKMVKYRLNLGKDLLFLKIIQKAVGDKLVVQ